MFRVLLDLDGGAGALCNLSNRHSLLLCNFFAACVTSYIGESAPGSIRARGGRRSMSKNYLVWLFDNRTAGTIAIEDHKPKSPVKRGSKTWVDVLYTDEVDKAGQKILETAQAGDNIYLLGHGNTGLTTLHSKSSRGESLTHDEVGSRLDWIGLPNVAVKLKFFSCYSGLAESSGTSLAQAVANDLAASHGNVQFFGYTSTVTDYQAATLFSEDHKWTSGSAFADRASSVRVQVIPKTG